MAYRELTIYELAAMWLYHNEYAAQNLGAVDFYTQLGVAERNVVGQMVKDFRAKLEEGDARAAPTTGDEE